MQRRSLLIGMLVVLSTLPLWSGDVASFVNLGFSDDSSVFLFGQYGIEDMGGPAYAEVFAVDVAENQFLKEGVFSKKHPGEISVGQDGSGALFNLLHQASPLIKERDIDHMNTGRPVYVLIDGEEPKSEVEFRDFVRGDSYKLELIQEKFGSGEKVSAAFHIKLTAKQKSGQTRSYTLGLPDYRREKVESYRIKAVYFSPAESGLVVVVEKRMWSPDGSDVRYMVETTSLK